jgi:uncharacterized integral membrane protein
MVFHWPQIVWCVINAVVLLVYAVKNGEPTNMKFNFPVVLVMAGFYAWLYYMGGFFAGASP